ncbi:MAG: hypothetical protein OER43_15230 [Gammaproteobacteria bacterium]|nr:hypothetical protein [Gammaproteobacteria bacterium]MDH3413996.1 hypothetical protein [Gammaproteobacteria bacterium]
MWLANIQLIQTIVWVIAGTAAWRLWDSPYDWVVWTIIPLLIFELGVAATLKRVVQEGASELVKSEEDLKAFRSVWGKVHTGVCLAAVGLGLYGHTLA